MAVFGMFIECLCVQIPSNTEQSSELPDVQRVEMDLE